MGGAMVMQGGQRGLVVQAEEAGVLRLVEVEVFGPIVLVTGVAEEH